MTGFKRLFQVDMPTAGGDMVKHPLVDLNQIPDPSGISTGTGLPGDVGSGNLCVPVQHDRGVLVLSPTLIAVTNDNNYLFDFGRHVGTRVPADNEFILVKLTNPCLVLHSSGSATRSIARNLSASRRDSGRAEGPARV